MKKRLFASLCLGGFFSFLYLHLHWNTFSLSQVILPERGLTYLTEEAMRYGTIFVPSLYAHPNKSRIYLKHAHKVYNLGDGIEVQMDLYDMNGDPKMTGGDFLRVWMENPETAASISGRVTDLNNGSYTALLKAVWLGNATIKAFIAARREEIVLDYMIFEKHDFIWPIFAEFRANNLKDATKCSANQENSLKTNEWCNFTNENNGSSYFCRKSKIKQLTCDTWSHTYSNNRIDAPLNTTERNILDLSVADSKLDVLKTSVKVSVRRASNDMERLAPTIPCNRLPSVITWQRKSPNGFFLHDRWHSLLCTDTLPRTTDAYGRCLKGKTLWLHGDSTSNQFKDALHSMFHFPSHWDEHVPTTDADVTHNFSVSWRAHELPFYHGGRHYNRSTNLGQDIMMDRLPNTTKDIVVLYLYVHFTLIHPDVFSRHVQRLVPSVKNLLARAPNVTVAVRGPHAFFRRKRGMLSYWGLLYTEIWHEAFASLQHQIVYLDFWDMTMAKAHRDFHPGKDTVEEMVHNMMSLLCFRK
ncbi:NXPE family member 3-like [Haliotis asinina]|uniref:NXPE family member 3-like n=1 Tax=Haliotis asinina TaxID=109174 RepID=UPI003531BC93